MGCSLETVEKNAGTWQSNRFLQNDAFFGAQGPSIQAKLTSGQHLLLYKIRGYCKELVCALLVGPTTLYGEVFACTHAF